MEKEKTEKIDVPKFEGWECIGLQIPDYLPCCEQRGVLSVDGKALVTDPRSYDPKAAHICYRKIKLRRITIEETTEIRRVGPYEWYEHDGVVSQWKGTETTHKYKIWQQVEE